MTVTDQYAEWFVRDTGPVIEETNLPKQENNF